MIPFIKVNQLTERNKKRDKLKYEACAYGDFSHLDLPWTHQLDKKMEKAKRLRWGQP